MTDKQIIDRVNVKECKYYCNGKCERYEEFVEADYANYSVKCICEKENDLGTYDICDYQQLKREEQECEELKDKLNCRFCYPIMKIDDPENFKLCQETDCFRRQLDQLKAENKELKRQLESTKGLITVGSSQYIQIMTAYDKIKSVLKTIKDIAYDGYNNGQTSYATSQCEKIINIISEIEQ